MPNRFAILALLMLRAAWSQTPPVPSESLPYAEIMRRAGPVEQLSLREAIGVALRHNLDLELESSNVSLARENLRASLGAYDPALVIAPSWNDSRSPTSSTLQAGANVRTLKTDTWSLTTTWQELLPGGGNFSAALNGSKTSINDQYVFINPLFNSGLDIHLSQPLWRGFRRTAVDRQIRISRLDQRIAGSHFRQLASDVVYQVAAQYWQLVLAVQTYEAIRQARDLASAQYQGTLRRQEAGLLSSVAVTSASTEVALRDRDSFQAEAGIATAENTFKALLASGPDDPLWHRALIPVDDPSGGESIPSLEEAIATALARRPEVEQVRLRADEAEVERRFQQQETRPAVNLILDGTSAGRTGTVILSDGSTIDPSDPSFGGLAKSLRQALLYNSPTWTAGVEVHLPVKNRTADAALAAAEINLRRSGTQLRSAQQAVLLDVRNAWQTIAAQKKGIEAAVASRRLSEEQLNGEMARFDAGFSTPFEVLRYQRDLTAARVEEMRAKVDYETALIRLQRAMNTLVDDSGVVNLIPSLRK